MKNTNKSPLQKLYDLLSRKDKLRFLFLSFLMLINAMFELLGVGAIPGLILLLTNPERMNGIPLIGSYLEEWHDNRSKQMFLFIAAGLFAIFLIKNIFAIFLNYLKGKFARSIQVELSRRLMIKYLRAPYRFHLSANVAELMRNLTGEVHQIINQVLIQALEFLLNVMVGLAILALLFIAEPLVSLVGISFFGSVSFIFLRLTKKRVRYLGNEAVRMRNAKNKMVLNSLTLAKEIKILGKENFFSKRFHQSTEREAYVTMHKTVMSKVPKALLEVLAIGLMLAVIVVMLYQDKEMNDMLALLALFAVAAARLMPVANQLSTSITNVRYALPSVDPVHRDLTTIDEEQTGSDVNFDLKEGILEARNLTFKYSETDSPVLKDLNFKIPLGSSVAFVGPSGAGKTTLVDVLIGILEPTSGSVICNEKNIHEGRQSWRRKIGYIPQQITLVNDTLVNNICLGEDPKEINIGRVAEIVQLAQLGDLVASLPQGLETLVGDRGIRLSGGQRQRIGIARALYRDPAILVMDEATSALDNLTEKFVVEALENLRGSRTIITIAHRLSTIKDCDMIFYMKGGEMVSAGTFDQLIELSEDFKIQATNVRL